jgi:HAD superfamily hydrolase (TIGR01549 family)
VPENRVGGALFDVDGTLVDSNYLHVTAWLRAFHDIGRTVEAWRIHRCIGMDSVAMLGELLGADASSLADEVKQRHADAYAESASLLAPLPGARELIRVLADSGVRVVLATSAPSDELATLRSVLAVDELITATTDADDVDTAKPDPDIVEIARQRSGCDADRVMFVGDSVWDMQAARRAGIAPIGFLSGGISAADLRDAGAEEIYDDPAHLLAHLCDSRLGALR